MSKQSSTVRVFGVRHHGLGCARALQTAFDEFAPDAVLLEGPPDADAALSFALDPQMQPPVALLVYPDDAPKRGVTYPFADFSPEWQAIVWARSRGVEVRFCDLPIKHRLAAVADDSSAAASVIEPAADFDPLDELARAAGFGDRELWWDHLIEQRRDLAGVFEAVLALTTELRDHAPAPTGVEAQREAFMRRSIRAACKRRARRIAVVCGAWHAPALADLGNVDSDDALLADLPKVKVTATWIPWTHARLALRSGYGAGIDSPGWYEQLWREPARAAAAWATKAARLLREMDLEAPSASVIETVRLAESLAALRGRTAPGLLELRESILTVLCHGAAEPSALIRDRLEIGDRMGTAPVGAPKVPLQRDLESQQRRLKLKPSGDAKLLNLDLRIETGRERSRLLHRLIALDIPWGAVEDVASRHGTFHEVWRLQWQVDFAVAVVEANGWGNTVESAAAARLSDQSHRAAVLKELVCLLEQSLLSDLPMAAQAALARLQAVAATATDIAHLLEAVGPLARMLRYGDVRRTSAGSIDSILEGIIQRALIGLPLAGRGIDDDAAERLARAMDDFRRHLQTLDRRDDVEEFLSVQQRIADDDRMHPRLRGAACRTLLSADRLSEADLAQRTALELSSALEPEVSCKWLQGLLEGGGAGIIGLERLWVSFNRWIAQLRPDAYLAVLPMLRRGFAAFGPTERRQMHQLVLHLSADGRGAIALSSPEAPRLDESRACRPVPVLELILGIRR